MTERESLEKIAELATEAQVDLRGGFHESVGRLLDEILDIATAAVAPKDAGKGNG